MTIIALLSSVCIMLSLTPIGYLQIGPVSATIMHLPVIIGAIVEGPIVGAIIGLVFGLTSFFRAVTTPTVTSFIFMNPLVSIVPRVLMGFLVYYVYLGILKATKKVSASGFIAGLIGSLLNTVGVLGTIYLLYADRYMEILGISGQAAKAIAGIAVTNGIPEAIVAACIVSPIAVIFNRKKKNFK
ncbi:MAG: ECF transporter S component [Clostridioides sp.]|nr:ECF transporter S component [Clostridioides sp.]